MQEQHEIVLDNVECEEDAEGTGHCSYSVEPNCKHVEDILLFCGTVEQCNKPAFTFYTVDRNNQRTSNGSGLLIASRSFYQGVS